MKLIVRSLMNFYDHGLTVRLSLRLGVGDMAHGCHPTYVLYLLLDVHGLCINNAYKETQLVMAG
jgi:hypothetical protein